MLYVSLNLESKVFIPKMISSYVFSYYKKSQKTLKFVKSFLSNIL